MDGSLGGSLGKLSGAMVDHLEPTLTVVHPGLDGPRGHYRALGLLPARQFLLGHGLSGPEQLLSAGMCPPAVPETGAPLTVSVIPC
jgi:hypothetical protein